MKIPNWDKGDLERCGENSSLNTTLNKYKNRYKNKKFLIKLVSIICIHMQWQPLEKISLKCTVTRSLSGYLKPDILVYETTTKKKTTTINMREWSINLIRINWKQWIWHVCKKCNKRHILARLIVSLSHSIAVINF